MTRRNHRRTKECRTELRLGHCKVAPHRAGRILIDGGEVCSFVGEVSFPGRVLGAHLGQHIPACAGTLVPHFLGEDRHLLDRRHHSSGLTCLHTGLLPVLHPRDQPPFVRTTSPHHWKTSPCMWAGLVTPERAERSSFLTGCRYSVSGSLSPAVWGAKEEILES